MPVLELSFASGESSLSVRNFAVHEAVSSLFMLSVIARSESPSIDLESIIGQTANMRVGNGRSEERLWTGIVNNIEQVQAAQPGVAGRELSTYSIRIVPKLWLLTQRTNYKIFQHMSIPDIIDALLAPWDVECAWEVSRGSYPKLEYRVQYGESDFNFMSRLLEEAGINYTFPNDGKGSTLTFSDKLESNPERPGGSLPYVDNPNQSAVPTFVTRVRLSRAVRPGAFTVRDYNFRNPAFDLFGDAPKTTGVESMLEQYIYHPGASLIEGGKGGGTPTADAKGVARHDHSFAKERADKMLGGARSDNRTVAFDTNSIAVWPGQTVSFERHPHADLGDGKRLLITEMSIEGTPNDEWTMSASASFADAPFRPAHKTQKPRVNGVQSATVVGPAGEEIHTDEYGRVRVQFPWDRDGKNDDDSSCWIRVNQGWGGTGYGMVVIPRIGQEVLVSFLEGDPDLPVIVGRVYNGKQTVPHGLPDNKTRSTWKSNSSPTNGGFNEIMFEDKKGQELVYEQAEKNRRRLVKNDESITIGNNREKYVKNDEQSKTDGFLKQFVGKDLDQVIGQAKRELIGGDSNLHVQGKRNQLIVGNQSLTVKGDRHEIIAEVSALAAEKEIHLKSKTKLVVHADDVTIRGPGGFIRINESGVTIRGKRVLINSGGSAADGSGSKPELPEPAIPANVDDVSKTLIGQ